ncbi:hypothetical protein [Rhizobium sp. Root1204]|uniref:hypothetical protein n=1 Tax=Rhizobium sp. Root1204 TaxID=1736428 RepID=UPI0007127572|nr:hypothetical protein [Rhizobium sp. Root1204]KQV31149.1 hypothetical protein ASC96_08130 [Rhizobium sp. Root1204]
MRWLAVLASLTAGTAAASDCGARNDKLITVMDWSAKEGDYSSVQVSIDYQNNGDKQIQMLKATAVFSDPFGENIANLALDPDVVVPPKTIHKERGSWSAARLPKVRKQDVTAIICVSAVLYEDGSKEEFK